MPTTPHVGTALRLVAGLAVAVGVALAPSAGRTNSGGALPGFAGDPVPGESRPATCAECHRSFALDSGAGGVTVTTDADAFGPGETVRVTVAVDNRTAPAEGGAARQGFEAVVRDAATDAVVGTVALVDAEATRFAGSDRAYVTQTAGGTARTSWSFDWTAPAAPTGPVRVYAAGNAANGDGGTSGDHVYTATADLAVASVAAAPPPRAPTFDLSPPRPNPARGATRLALSGAGWSSVRVVDGRGRTVGAARVAGGAVAVETAGLAPGTYFVVADGPGGRASGRSRWSGKALRARRPRRRDAAARSGTAPVAPGAGRRPPSRPRTTPPPASTARSGRGG